MVTSMDHPGALNLNISAKTLVFTVYILSQSTACAGLEQLAMNTNPNFLSYCARDELCTRVTCRILGFLLDRLRLFSIILKPCETPPGIILELSVAGHTTNQLINNPTTITQNRSMVIVETYVFVNSTSSTIGISVSIDST